MIYEDNAAWVRKFLPFDGTAAMLRMLKCCYPMWDSLIFPSGIAERVLHGSCVTSLMFEVDDMAVLEHALFEDIAGTRISGNPYGPIADIFEDIAGTRISGNPYGPAFADIFGTLKRAMPEGVWRRYRASWQDWFAHVLRENKLRKALVIPDVDTYLDIRRLSVGLQPSIITAEYVLDQDLTEALAADPELARLGGVAVEHAMFVNDLFSFREECFKGDNFNIVASLLHTEGHTLQRAIEIICDKVREADEALVNLSNALRRRYTAPSMRAYIDILNTFCAGNLRWSMETTRYNGHDSAWNGLRSGVVTLHQNQTSIAAE